MANELFGAPRGFIAYDQNQYTRAKTQETLSDVAMMPTKRRLAEAQAAKLEEEVAAETRLAAIAMAAQQEGSGSGRPEFWGVEGAEQFGTTMNVAQGGAGTSLPDLLDRIARNAAGAGMVTKAADLAGKAALVRSRDARQQEAQAGTRIKQLQLVRDDARLTASLVGDVTDQESWERANALYQFQTGRPSRYSSLPYSPELVQNIKSGAISAEKAAELEERRVTRDATKAYRDARLGQIDTQNDIRERRLNLERERQERLAKAGGGKSVTSPTKAEIDQATRLIKKDYPNLSPADLNDAAYTVASEARSLRRRNRALDANGALQQALNGAVQAGDFQVQPKTAAGIEIPGMKTSTYLGRGKTVRTPAPIPEKKGGLVSGRFYVNAQGQVAKWNGKGFELTRGLSGNNSRVDPDDADDNDDLDPDDE